MDSLQNYLQTSIGDFFDLRDENKTRDDVEVAVEYVKWYKSHNNTHPSINSTNLEEVHMAYWRLKMFNRKKMSPENVLREGFGALFSNYGK